MCFLIFQQIGLLNEFCLMFKLTLLWSMRELKYFNYWNLFKLVSSSSIWLILLSSVSLWKEYSVIVGYNVLVIFSKIAFQPICLFSNRIPKGNISWKKVYPFPLTIWNWMMKGFIHHPLFNVRIALTLFLRRNSSLYILFLAI